MQRLRWTAISCSANVHDQPNCCVCAPCHVCHRPCTFGERCEALPEGLVGPVEQVALPGQPGQGAGPGRGRSRSISAPHEVHPPHAPHIGQRRQVAVSALQHSQPSKRDLHQHMLPAAGAAAKTPCVPWCLPCVIQRLRCKGTPLSVHRAALAQRNILQKWVSLKCCRHYWCMPTVDSSWALLPRLLHAYRGASEMSPEESLRSAHTPSLRAGSHRSAGTPAPHAACLTACPCRPAQLMMVIARCPICETL